MISTAASYFNYLTSDVGHAVVKISHCAIAALREYLDSRGFIEVLPPVVSTVTDPGLRGAERVPVSLYGQKAFVTSSMIFHKQVLATAFSKIYAVSPNVRLEPAHHASSGRHLVEFCQLDVEEACVTLEDSMKLCEGLIKYAIEKVIDKCGSVLGFLGRKLTPPPVTFPRFTYDEVLEIAHSLGYDMRYGEELPQEAESKVSEQVGTFFWIVDYPSESRGFYYRRVPGEKITRSMDLIYPDGFGEAVSGGEREYEPSAVRRNLAEHGLDESEFADFLAFVDAGLAPTSGFGLGIERFVRFITGIRDISMARPFAKQPGFMRM